MTKLLARLEMMFMVVALILYSGGPLNLILSGGYSQGDRQVAEPDFAILRLIYMLTYLVVGCLALIRIKRVLAILSKDWFIVPLVGFVVLSYFWSAIPSVTMSQGIALVGTTLTGIYLATRYTPREQLKILGWVLGAIIVMSLIFALLPPRWGVMGGVHAGAWRGIYIHKNSFGRAMALCSITFLLLASDPRSKRFLCWLGCALSVGMLILSTSTTALLNLINLILLVGVFQIFRWHYRTRVVALIVSILTVSGTIYLLTHNLEPLLASFGKDMTLTGRTDLWPHVVDMIRQRPWFGYGYGAFWRDWDSDGATIWRAVGWTPPHSHNGFLDMMLHIGIIGFAIFAIGYLYIYLKGIFLLTRTRTPEGMWPLVFLSFMVLFSLSENTFLGRNNIYWVLYVASVLSVQAMHRYELRSSQSELMTASYPYAGYSVSSLSSQGYHVSDPDPTSSDRVNA